MQLAEGKWGADPTRGSDFSGLEWLDRPAAAHSGQRAAGRPGGILLHRDHRRGLHSAVHHAGRRRPDFRPDGANLCLRAGRRADRDLHRDAMSRVAAAPGTRRGSRNHRRARTALDLYAGAALVAAQPAHHDRDRTGLSRCLRLSSARGSAANSCRRSKKAISGFAPRCRRRFRWKPASRSSTRSGKSCCAIPKSSPSSRSTAVPDDGSDAAGFYNAEFFVPLKPFDEWPPDVTKETLINDLQAEFAKRIRRHRFQFLAIHPGQCRGRPVGRQRRQLGEDHRPRSGHARRDRARGHARNGAGAGHHRSRRILGARSAQLEHQGRSRQGGALRAERQRRQQRRASGVGRNRGDHATGSRIANSAWWCGSRREYRNNIDAVRNLKVGVQTPDRQRLYPAERARLDHARHRRLLHFPRAQPALRADQVQRARPRSRRRRGRTRSSASPQREAADRLSHRMVGRVRMAAAGQEAACHHSSRSRWSSSWCCSTACSIRCATA